MWMMSTTRACLRRHLRVQIGEGRLQRRQMLEVGVAVRLQFGVLLLVRLDDVLLFCHQFGDRFLVGLHDAAAKCQTRLVVVVIVLGILHTFLKLSDSYRI